MATSVQTGRAVAARTAVLLVPAIVVSNVVGAFVVYACVAWLLPATPLEDPDRVDLANLVAVGGYLLVAVPVGVVWGAGRLRLLGWVRSGERPDVSQRDTVLRGPLRLMTVHAVLWGVAVVAFGVLNTLYSPALGVKVMVTVVLGGLTTCAIVYLVSERLLRPAFRWALTQGVPRRPPLPGVAARSMLAWALGTGVPVLGLLFIAIDVLSGRQVGERQLAITTLGLGGGALVVGAFVTYLAAKATADPVVAVRQALARVEEGAEDVEVAVYDGTEVGLLQAGFNRMAVAVREREQLRDLFGRHVGEDVARAALEQGVALGGEERDVAVLFVDVVGSTRLAAERPPDEVVAALNGFFAVVVDVVGGHGGWINKFQGDAALAVFGVPVAREDAPACALAAARQLGRRLREEVPALQAGVGVSAGRAVAGNVGDERRFEYTVIGDPVNEAARLSDEAKARGAPVLASAATVEAAGEPEAVHWALSEEVTLRGRTAPTRLAVPA